MSHSSHIALYVIVSSMLLLIFFCQRINKPDQTNADEIAAGMDGSKSWHLQVF
jgi:hypothetical protein